MTRRLEDVDAVVVTGRGRAFCAGMDLSAEGNVFGLMPHPEHAVEALTGPGTDGLGFFTSLLQKVGV